MKNNKVSCAFYLHEINKHKILFHPLRISKLCEFNSNKFETKANLQLYVKLQTSSCNRLDKNGPVNFAMLNCMRVQEIETIQAANKVINKLVLHPNTFLLSSSKVPG